MALTYTSYQAQLSNLMVVLSSDPNFVTFLPGCIDYAEQRIYRELDLQATRFNDFSATVSSGVRYFNLPTDLGTFLIVEQFNIFTPVASISTNTVRVPLTPVTKEYLDFAWPTSTNTGVPVYYAPLNNTTFILGPTPDQAYPLEVVGTIRPTPLSSGNSSTFLTQVLPDLFIAASMVFASGYMRNFGAQTDDPQMAGSWETQYKQLFASANNEELRKRFQSQGWQSMTPNAIATPPRM